MKSQIEVQMKAQILEIMRDQMQDYLDNQMQDIGMIVVNETLTEVEDESREGFWAWTNGGFIASGWTDLDTIDGQYVKIKPARDKIFGIYKCNERSDLINALEWFDCAESNYINYGHLSDLQRLAEERIAQEDLDEFLHEQYQEGCEVFFNLGAHIYIPSNLRGEFEGVWEVYVYSAVNTDLGYGRSFGDNVSDTAVSIVVEDLETFKVDFAKALQENFEQLKP